MGRAVKNSLEIIIKQVRLEGSFERGARMGLAVENAAQFHSWPSGYLQKMLSSVIAGLMVNVENAVKYHSWPEGYCRKCCPVLQLA